MTQYLIQHQATPKDFMEALKFEFDTPNFDVEIKPISPDHYESRIFTSRNNTSESQTSINITAILTENGLSITASDQEWGQIAASLGTTVVAAIINPINLLGRIDNLAVDVENMQLSERIDKFVHSFATTLAERSETQANRSTCKYCRSRNDQTATHCASCGAPL